MDNEFAELYENALDAAFSGWDFSYLESRMRSNPLPWNYEQMVCELAQDLKAKNGSVLDMGTGGGEFLASIMPSLPLNVHATEGYSPNISVAKARLSGLGVTVHGIAGDVNLPLPTNAFDLVINRHESFSASEVGRILKPGGLFLTQQVGSLDNIQLNHFFQDHSRDDNPWNLSIAAKLLDAAGLSIIRAEECFPPTTFADIGAIVYYLRAIPWQIPGFEIGEHEKELQALHGEISKKGFFATTQHRFLIMARRV